jgi:hypothetical protein
MKGAMARPIENGSHWEAKGEVKERTWTDVMTENDGDLG